MTKRIKCQWGCGKKIKDADSHARYCSAHSVRNECADSARAPENDSAAHQEAPSIKTTKDAFLSGETHTFQELTNEWNKVKDELKVSDDELLSQKQQKVQQIQNNIVSNIDCAQLKSYEVLANSLHQSVNDFIIFATKGKLRMQKEQLERLNECGAQVLHKYDKNGKIAQYVPELAYVLTLTDVVAQVLLVMKKDEVKNGGAKNDSGAVGREGQTNQGVAGAS